MAIHRLGYHTFPFPSAGINRETVRKIVRSVNYPYKLQKVQQLNEFDPEARMDLCRWALGRLEGDPIFFR